MGTSTIDGTVEAAEIKRARGGITIFKSIQFRLNDGSSRTITKQVAKQAVADALTPGTKGRFYLFTGFDLKGVHGVRKSDGSAILDFPANNAKAFLILSVVSVLWVTLRVAVGDGVPLTGVAFLIFGIVGYVLMSKTAREAKQQFESDAGTAPVTAEPGQAALR